MCVGRGLGPPYFLEKCLAKHYTVGYIPSFQLNVGPKELSVLEDFAGPGTRKNMTA